GDAPATANFAARLPGTRSQAALAGYWRGTACTRSVDHGCWPARRRPVAERGNPTADVARAAGTDPGAFPHCPARQDPIWDPLSQAHERARAGGAPADCDSQREQWRPFRVK